MRTRLLVMASSAALLASGITGVLPGAPAGAADASCVTRTGFTRAPGLGAVVDVPAGIDATGTREVSTELQQFLAAVPDGTAEAPTLVRFAPGGTYWVDYTLVLAKRGSGGIAGSMWPDMAVFQRNHLILDLQGATLVQRSSRAFSSVDGVVTEPRKRWGAPLLYTGGASDIEITNGTLWGANQNGTYSASREPWAGVYITGNGTSVANRIWVHDLTIRNPWGDFVYVAAKAHMLQGVVIERNVMSAAGRQGVVINAGDDVTVAENTITNVDRFVFDSEPTSAGGWTNLMIAGNRGNAGGLGYFQFSAGAGLDVDRLGIIGNTISTGNFRIRASGSSEVTRECAVIAFNRNVGTRQFKTSLAWPQLMRVGAWTNVVVRKNYDQVYPDGSIRALYLDLAQDVSAGDNCFAGAVDDTCGEPDTTPPSTPELTVRDVRAASLAVTWTPSTDASGVTSYRVYRNGVLLDTTTETSFADTRLTPLTGYIYQVEAVDYWGNPSAKGFVGVTTPADVTAPSVVTDVAATASAPDSVRVTWSAASDDVKVVGYRVYRDGVAMLGTATGLARSMTNLTPATTYRFEITALDAAGNESARSAAISITTPPDTTAPSEVPSVSASVPTPGSVTLRWGTASDDVRVGGYVITQDGMVVASTGAAARSVTVKGLTSGRPYSFAVLAVDTSGNRSATATPVAITP